MVPSLFCKEEYWVTKLNKSPIIGDRSHNYRQRRSKRSLPQRLWLQMTLDCYTGLLLSGDLHKPIRASIFSTGWSESLTPNQRDENLRKRDWKSQWCRDRKLYRGEWESRKYPLLLSFSLFSRSYLWKRSHELVFSQSAEQSWCLASCHQYYSDLRKLQIGFPIPGQPSPVQ